MSPLPFRDCPYCDCRQPADHLKCDDCAYDLPPIPRPRSVWIRVADLAWDFLFAVVFIVIIEAVIPWIRLLFSH